MQMNPNTDATEQAAPEAGIAAVRERQCHQNRPCSAWTVEDRQAFQRAYLRVLIDSSHGAHGVEARDLRVAGARR